MSRSLAVQIQALEMKSPEDLDGAFEAANRGHAKALIVLSSPLTLRSRTLIGDIAVKRRLPTMYLCRALISYGPDLPEMFRRCGVYVGRILGGVKPGELPEERPVRFDLAINLKTAKALGVTTPQSILVRADQVIE
jgi:ABC-type uncharacterized transport system substrate-binding protein